MLCSHTAHTMLQMCMLQVFCLYGLLGQLLCMCSQLIVLSTRACASLFLSKRARPGVSAAGPGLASSSHQRLWDSCTVGWSCSVGLIRACIKLEQYADSSQLILGGMRVAWRHSAHMLCTILDPRLMSGAALISVLESA